MLEKEIIVHTPIPSSKNELVQKEESLRWSTIITSERSLLSINLKEIWAYKDLLLLFIRRDIVALYKQTILGPIWFFLQPLFTSLIFTLVFNRLAGISTEGVPPLLFYIAGITCWTYFADSLKKTSTTFKDNQAIFGKVYFPRIVVPISIVLSSLLKFGIQFLLFLGFFLYYRYVAGYSIEPTVYITLFPLLIVILAGLGLGFGLLITSLTTKYRDLVFLLEFGIQLAMYATPVIYPLSAVPERFKLFALINPISAVIETFKLGFLGRGTFQWSYLAYSFLITCTILFIGIIVFNRTEKNFMDTV